MGVGLVWERLQGTRCDREGKRDVEGGEGQGGMIIVKRGPLELRVVVLLAGTTTPWLLSEVAFTAQTEDRQQHPFNQMLPDSLATLLPPMPFLPGLLPEAQFFLSLRLVQPRQKRQALEYLVGGNCLMPEHLLQLLVDLSARLDIRKGEGHTPPARCL